VLKLVEKSKKVVSPSAVYVLGVFCFFGHWHWPVFFYVISVV